MVGETGVVLLLTRVEAEVFEQGDAPVLQPVDDLGGARPDAVVSPEHFLFEQVRQRRHDRLQTHLRHDPALGAVEVGQQHHLGAVSR